jgi:cyclopropane fatty-acyl-phospholipid synthase-like methyltransferase
LYRL